VEIEKTVSRERIKPTFNNGVQGDATRNISGYIPAARWSALGEVAGVFKENSVIASPPMCGSTTSTTGFLFDASLVVPVGNDNAPRTHSVRLWRRVA